VSKTRRRIPLAMAMLYGADPGLAKDQEIARLRAENERLRKAGDAMSDELVERNGRVSYPETVEAWLVAKGVWS